MHSIIHEIPSSYGNPVIAQGTFGQVSIAIQQQIMNMSAASEDSYKPKESQPSAMYSIDDRAYDSRTSIRFVVIKKISNSIQEQTNEHHLDDCTEIRRSSFHEKDDTDETSKREKGESSFQLTRAAVGELAALRVLSNHPNVTSLLSAYIGDGTNSCQFSNDLSKVSLLSLVFPFCPLDLSIIIQLHRPNKTKISENRNGAERSKNLSKGRINISIIRTIMRDILSGLAHCHSKGIIHGDIKPSNLLMTFDGKVQLADFGLAQSYSQSNSDTIMSDSQQYNDIEYSSIESSQYTINSQPHGICTIFYRPPELLFGSTRWTPAIDIWSSGCVFAELLTLYPLFPGKNVLNQLDLIFDVFGTIDDVNDWPTVSSDLPDYTKVQFTPRKGLLSLSSIVIQAGQSELLNEMIKSMCSLNPRNRPESWKCLHHGWFYELPKAENSGAIADQFLRLIKDDKMKMTVWEHKKHNLPNQDLAQEISLESMKLQGTEFAAISRRLRSCVA